jgi:hypothetical protein
MSEVGKAMNKQADAATKLSDAAAAYLNAEVAKINAAKADVLKDNAQGIASEAIQGYNDGGVLGAVKYAATSEAAEAAAKTAVSVFLPPPFGWIAAGIIGFAFPFVRKWLRKTNLKEDMRNRTEMLESNEVTDADRLEAAKAKVRTEPPTGSPAPPTE